jgi:thiol-disulfide isomerase/thioredoxin
MKKVLFILSLATFTNFSFSQSNIAVGATCPDFTVTDVAGNTHSLYAICEAGNYVLIDFFAYWCGPCAQIAPIFDEFYTKYGCNAGNVFSLGMESDANSTLEQLNTFKQQAGISSSTLPTVLGSQGGNGVRGQFGVGAFPTIVLIGPDKKMINNDIWPISNGVASFEAAFPSGTLTEMSCSSASIDQSELSANLTLFPNPVVDVLNIAIDQITNINVVDASGKSVFNADYETLDQVEFSVKDLEAGIYFLNVTTVNGIATSRFVKQ